MNVTPGTLRLLILLAALLIASATAAGDKVDETREVDADAEIEINNLAGVIEVIGWDRDEVRVEGVLDDKAKKLVIDGDRGRLEIKVKYPRKIKGNLKGSELKIHVPRACDLQTESISADVDVRDVVGPVMIESVSGEISVAGAPATLKIEAVSGVIGLEAACDDIELEAVSGDIFIQRAGRRLTVSCVSGDAEIRAETLEDFEFNTVSGELDLTANPADGGRWNIDCHSGEVVLNLPADVDAEFDIDTFSGDIDDDFGHEAERTSKYAPGKELRFVQGDGGARINISVFSGQVEIKKR